MKLELHCIYKLRNGEFVIAIEKRDTGRGWIMVMTKVGEVPGYHHRLDGTHVDDCEEFDVVAEIKLTTETVCHTVAREYEG